MLYLLQGGPGASSVALENAMHLLWLRLQKKVTIVTMDHRGVGRSERLGCRSVGAETRGSAAGVLFTPSEVRECVDEYLYELGTDTYSYAFTADNAARDLHKVIERLRAEQELAGLGQVKVFVYGLSYGTWLVQRFALLFPGSVDGVALDGVMTMQGAPGTLFSFDNFDAGMNRIALRFVDACRADEFCRAKLGDDPKGRFERLFEKLFGEGHCAAGLEALGVSRKATLVKRLGAYVETTERRHMLTAFALRLDRCSEADVEALGHMHQFAYAKEVATCDAHSHTPESKITKFNIVSSEIFNLKRKYQDILAEAAGLYVAGGAIGFYTVAHEWPLYPRDEATFNRTLLDPDTPYLLMVGTLDPQTPKDPYAEQTYADLEGRVKTRTLVTFPGSPHFTLQRSRMAETQTTGVHCGMLVLASFVASDGQVVDQSCVARMLPVDYAGDAATNKELFGLEDVYDGTVPEAEAGECRGGNDGVESDTFTAVVVVMGVMVVALSVVVWRLCVQVRGLRGVGKYSAL